MNLGSIAHLQYFFARTGLLDGKGGQFAKGPKNTLDSSILNVANSTEAEEYSGFGSITEETISSPMQELEISNDWDDSILLPPTVSTYSQRSGHVQPPPDLGSLRKSLKEGLLHVAQAVEESRMGAMEKAAEDPGLIHMDEETFNNDGQKDEEDSVIVFPSQGWHEVQGMHMLDVVTMAIRAAKIYYTTQERPHRFGNIKSERQVREELLTVLDVLQCMAARRFAGGIKQKELQSIEDWVHNVEGFLAKEEASKEQELQDRQNCQWLQGDWIDGDRRREWLFLTTFIGDVTLPPWHPEVAGDDQIVLPTPFLQVFRTGLALVRLHNTILTKTKRRFGEIKTFHTDTAKPYRCADNLRYWIKAAEIRWEIKLQVDVMGIVYNKGDSAWKVFDTAILQWCRAVRQNLTTEWKDGIL